MRLDGGGHGGGGVGGGKTSSFSVLVLEKQISGGFSCGVVWFYTIPVHSGQPKKIL